MVVLQTIKATLLDFQEYYLDNDLQYQSGLSAESSDREFLNRIDEIIVFHELSPEHIRSIVKLQANLLQKRLESMDIKISFTEEFYDYMSVKGYDPAYGARPVKRVLQRELIDYLATLLLDGTLSKESEITATFVDGKLKLY